MLLPCVVSYGRRASRIFFAVSCSRTGIVSTNTREAGVVTVRRTKPKVEGNSPNANMAGVLTPWGAQTLYGEPSERAAAVRTVPVQLSCCFRQHREEHSTAGHEQPWGAARISVHRLRAVVPFVASVGGLDACLRHGWE